MAAAKDVTEEGSVVWTKERVQRRLEEAISVLARLPSAEADAYLGIEPPNSRANREKLKAKVCGRCHDLPRAKELARMQETLNWFHWLSSDEQHLLWMRAARVQWKVICARSGLGRTEMWQRWSCALAIIVIRLEPTFNAGNLLS